MHPLHERVSLASIVQIYAFVVIRVAKVRRQSEAPRATILSYCETVYLILVTACAFVDYH
jgi:hypothetical protein